MLDQLVRLDAELFEYVRDRKREQVVGACNPINEHTAEEADEVSDQSADASEQEDLAGCDLPAC